MSTEKTRIVAPDKPKFTDVAELSPLELSYDFMGYWLEFRDVIYGPFESKVKAHQSAGIFKAELCGWTDPVNAKIYRDAGGWYVDRYFIDGPFETEGLAKEHKQKLIREKGWK